MALAQKTALAARRVSAIYLNGGSETGVRLSGQGPKATMAPSLKTLMSSVLGPRGKDATELFAKTDPATDGDECLRDCESCAVRYPRGFSIDVDDKLYGQINAWSTHLLVGTGKTDWVRDVADEKGSVMEAVERADAPSNGVSPSTVPESPG